MENASRHDDDLAAALADIAGRRGCHLLPPVGQAALPDHLTLPDDLRRFHELCGGVILFEGGPFEWKVSGPSQLVPASPKLLGTQLAQEVAEHQPTDLTNGCFVLAETGPGSTDSIVVIDLHPARAGRCYDAFWDSYGLASQMPILALTLSELLHRLLATHGTHGLHSGPTHGDAYDNISQPT